MQGGRIPVGLIFRAVLRGL